MIKHEKDKNVKGSWISYRPDIEILDCTIRDGGLINNHFFEDKFVKAVYDTLVEAGIQYMEIGYKGSKKLFSPKDFGIWKFCDEDKIRKVLGDKHPNIKLSVMADAEKCDYKEDILPRGKSIVSCIRVASYIHQIPIALDMIKDAHDKGYETTMNIMAISAVQDKELSEAVELVAKSPVDVVYIVDSFGSYYSEQIRDLTLSFMNAVKGTDKKIGIHAHNNMQLAYANTIESLILGTSRLDVTINGMGRGAGNCPLELLIGFLKNPNYHQRPVLKLIEELFLPLQSKMEWGYKIPYMITGQLNQHPRSAIKIRSGDGKDKYVSFYDQMTEEE